MDEREFELRKIEFENSIKLRGFEIDNFWKRGWFFGALLLALLTSYFQVKTSKPEFKIQEYSVCIAFVAFLVSLFQSLMNRGSKYWQERWEYKTKNRESALEVDITKTRNYNKHERYLIDASILAKNENPLLRSARFSVSKLTILVWDILTLFCVFVWFSEVATHICMYYDSAPSCPSDVFEHLMRSPLLIFHLLIVGYIRLVTFEGKIFEALLQSPNNNDQGVGKFFNDSESYVENIEFDSTKER